MANIPSEKDAYAAVICRGYGDADFRGCGQVPLTEAQYVAQLSLPDITWRCPRCGQEADFDDTYFEDVHGLNDEVEDDEPAF